MSNSKDRLGRWAHRALTLALLVMGVVVVTLLYALVSQSFSSGPTLPTPASQASSVSTSDSTSDIIQVGVRNGCGRNGLAAQMRNYLVRHHFDVVEVGDHSSFDLDSSLVIDRVGNRRAARRVAAALGIPPRRIQQDLNPEYYLDATVLIGNDYRTLKPFRDRTDDESTP